MSSQSVGKYVPTRRVSWLSTTYRAMRSYATSSNLIGLICGVAVIFLLLVPPLPWNIRLPLYLIVLIWTIILLICLAGISQAFYGYIQAFFNIGPQAFIRDASLRVYGTFDQPNPYAGYINIPLSIALALTLLGRGWLTRILAGLTAILLGIAEYLSQSRGGEMAIAAALVFIVLAGMPRILTLMRVLIIALLGFFEALLAGWIPLHIFNPVLHFLGLVQISLTQPSSQDYSTAERLAHWIAGLHMVLDHPILGVGIGNYADAYPQYFITVSVHNLVDDLYVHSLTTLIALLLIALIRLEWVTPGVTD